MRRVLTDGLPLTRFARISARLQAGESKSRVLATEGISPAEWTVVQQEWLAEIARQQRAGNHSLPDHFMSLMVAEQQRLGLVALPSGKEASPSAKVVGQVDGGSQSPPEASGVPSFVGGAMTPLAAPSEQPFAPVLQPLSPPSYIGGGQAGLGLPFQPSAPAPHAGLPATFAPLSPGLPYPGPSAAPQVPAASPYAAPGAVPPGFPGAAAVVPRAAEPPAAAAAPPFIPDFLRGAAMAQPVPVAMAQPVPVAMAQPVPVAMAQPVPMAQPAPVVMAPPVAMAPPAPVANAAAPPPVPAMPAAASTDPNAAYLQAIMGGAAPAPPVSAAPFAASSPQVAPAAPVDPNAAYLQAIMGNQVASVPLSPTPFMGSAATPSFVASAGGLPFMAPAPRGNAAAPQAPTPPTSGAAAYFQAIMGTSAPSPAPQPAALPTPAQHAPPTSTDNPTLTLVRYVSLCRELGALTRPDDVNGALERYGLNPLTKQSEDRIWMHLIETCAMTAAMYRELLEGPGSSLP